MKQEEFSIQDINCILYGNKSSRVFLYVHGKGGNKNEAIHLAEIVCKKGYQVLAFDMKIDENFNDYTPWLSKKQLSIIYDYLKSHYDLISLYAISLGAFFSLHAFENITFNTSILVSPVVNMKELIENMMLWANVDLKTLENKKRIETSFGEVLDIQYYNYVCSYPITKVNQPTYIIYPSLDHLTSLNTIETFSKKHHCHLYTIKNSQHYIHLPEEMKLLDSHLKSIIQ